MKPAAKIGSSVVFLNPTTCGISKDGGALFRVDKTKGVRTDQLDDELNAHVDAYLSGTMPDGSRAEPVTTQRARTLVPRYHDPRWDAPFDALLESARLDAVTLGDLQDAGELAVRTGHGSPSADFRTGDVPYIKVSDLRALRVNTNPTNMIPRELARKFWRSDDSGLQGWDLLTPNRASSNIGEFVVLLPGEEDVVLTKEIFVLRTTKKSRAGLDPFYLLWALSLQAVRRQWQRVTFMQTNREDVGDRYREVRIPAPRNATWAATVSAPFRDYFTTLADARTKFLERVRAVESGDDPMRFIGTIR